MWVIKVTTLSSSEMWTSFCCHHLHFLLPQLPTIHPLLPGNTTIAKRSQILGWVHWPRLHCSCSHAHKQKLQQVAKHTTPHTIEIRHCKNQASKIPAYNQGETQDLKFAVCGRVPGMLESRYGKGCTRFPPFPRPGGPTITCSSSSESAT